MVKKIILYIITGLVIFAIIIINIWREVQIWKN
jgi:hypothetical protein